LLSELNRFTINSVNHPHSDEGRQALGDDNYNNHITPYWLRSPGHLDYQVYFIVAFIHAVGFRTAVIADHITHGFRPIL